MITSFHLLPFALGLILFWSPISFTEWYHCQPRSFHDDGVDFCPDAIFSLPQLSDRHIAKIHKPSVRLIAQPDPLKLVAAKAFQLPRARERGRDGLLPVDSSPIQAENLSENSLFNEIIHGHHLGEETAESEDEGAQSNRTPPVEVPPATGVHQPSFPKAQPPPN